MDKNFVKWNILFIILLRGGNSVRNKIKLLVILIKIFKSMFVFENKY